MSDYGKFKDADVVYKAYLDIEKEFTRKCKLLKDLEQEQIAEMQEHTEAMQVADKRIKELEEENKELIQQIKFETKGFENFKKIAFDVEKQLYRQLYDLPKKICNEIRERLLEERTEITFKFDDFNNGRYASLFWVKEIVDQIQAKFEKGE